MKNKVKIGIASLCCTMLAVSMYSLFKSNSVDNSKFHGFYSNAIKTLAEENVETNESITLFTETKGMKSVDGKYMLLTTGIKLTTNELSNYKAVGYELTINGTAQDDRVTNYYYTAIEVSTGDETNPTHTFQIADIFSTTEDVEVSGMIVDEIEYSKSNSYVFRAFLVDNEDNKIYAESKGKTAIYTLTLADGFKFADGSTSKDLSANETLPEIINETGKTIAGWYTSDENHIWSNEEFVMPDESITIHPYYAPNAGTSLEPCSGKSYLPDYFDNLDATAEEKASDEYKAKFDKSNLKYKKAIIDGIKGAEIDCTTKLINQDYFRMLTAVGTNGVVAGTNYRFNFKFENRSSEAITFEVIQVQSQVQISAKDGAVTMGNITLQPGEHKDASIEMSINKNNSNVMTVIVIHSDVTNLKLGVAMSKEDNIVIEKKYTLSLDSSYVTFANGNTSVELAQGESIPEVINNVAGRTIVGWTDGNKTYDLNFKMVASDITLKPVFSAQEGFTALTFGYEQSSHRPQQLKDIVGENFTNVNDASTLVAGGENGYIEKDGNIVTYNGAMSVDSAFRFASVVNKNSAVVTKGKNHQFAYNFENKGEYDIHLRMYQINSGANISDNIYVDIDLQPGESMSVVLIANFNTGENNKNALSYFKVTQDMANGMKLGVTMSVKLAQ